MSTPNNRLGSAALLTAAPELLACLQHAVRWHDQLKPQDLARYEAVIAKATQPRQSVLPKLAAFDAADERQEFPPDDPEPLPTDHFDQRRDPVRAARNLS